MKKRRRFKKRYIPLIFLALVMILAHGCLSFRSSDAEWTQNLTAKGQIEPNIQTYHYEGRNIHYIHVGEDTLPLIVFLHGSPGSSSAFEDYLADTNLTKHAQLISVDRPGFGYSDFGKTAKSLDEQSYYLKPLLERHPAPKTILVGHSLGGSLSVRMAMDYQEKIDAIVLLAGSVGPEQEPYEPYRPVMNWKIIRWMIPTIFRVSNQEILPVKGDLERMLPLWENITIPVVIAHGRKDQLVTYDNVPFAQKMLTNSSRVDIIDFPEENHFIPWTQYDTISKTLIKEVYRQD